MISNAAGPVSRLQKEAPLGNFPTLVGPVVPVEGDSCPVRVVVLAVPRYARHPVYVMVNPGAGASSCPAGRDPDAKSVICMVDEVHLSFVGQSGCRQERWRQGNGRQHCFAFNIWELCKDGLPYHTRIGACTVLSNE